MKFDPADLLNPPPQDAAAASPMGGTRAQAMQRLQVGLSGLAAMVLLVGLANIIMTNAKQNQALVVPEAAPTVAADAQAKPVSDPLVDAGVVPELPAATPSPESTVTVQVPEIVADLPPQP